MIKLSGEVGDDILQQNPDFDRELEKYRTNKYVDPQLDTCRSIADIVWNEFKRTAIIEIAQAQANKIEEINELLDDLAMNILYDEKSQNADPFWEKTSADYFSGVALGLFEDGVLVPGTQMLAEIVTAGDYVNISFHKLLKICCRGDATLTIQSIPSVLTGATLPGVVTATEIPVTQNANFSIIRKC